MTNICSAIACPFWGAESKRYGCQRYTFSNSCHLRIAHPDLQANEYALYTQGQVAEGLKQENDRFFIEDPHYQDKLEFLEEFPDLRDCSFAPRDIRSDR